MTSASTSYPASSSRPTSGLKPLDLREQESLPDELQSQLKRPESVGQTALAHADRCLRSFALYTLFGGGIESHALARGTVFHQFAEEMTDFLLEQGEISAPPEIGKDRMQALIDERTDVVLPEREQDVLRLAAWNWSSATVVDPQTIIANETTLSLELEGWTVRGRIDRADILPSRELLIRDWKTSLALPSQEDFEHDFQAKTYALLVAEGHEEESGLSLGEGFPAFTVRIELPRRVNEETGELAYREVTFTRGELHDFRLSLGRLLRQISENFESNEWRAVPGSHCSTCPAAAHCPIDARFRTLPGEQAPPQPVPSIESVAAAEELAEEKVFIDARSAGIQKVLREWSRDNGPVRVGTDLEFDFGYQASRSVRDLDALEIAIGRTVEFGEDFDLNDHIRVRQSTPYKKRKVKVDE